MLSTTLILAAVMSSSAATDSTRPLSADSTREQSPTVPISIFGELRTRSEWDKPISGASSDLFTLMRSRLGIRLEPSSMVSIVLQAQDSRVFGDAGSSARQTFDLHQGFIQLSHKVDGRSLELRVGRQELSFGNERLVEVGKWSNFGKAYDGLRASVGPDRGNARWSLDVFAATMEERGRRFGADRTSARRDQTIGGAFLTTALDRAGESRLDLTLLADAGTSFRSYHDTRRYTADARFAQTSFAGLRFEAEAALQMGTQEISQGGDSRSQDINAYLLGLRVGNSVNKQSPVALTAGVDILSGDRTPGDGEYSAFNILNGSNHAFYGLMDVFADPSSGTRDRGLQDFLVQGDFRLNERVRLQSQLHKMFMAVGDGRDYGWEADFALPFELDRQTRLELGYALFKAGKDAASVGLAQSGKTQHWLYLQLSAAFSQ